MYIRCPNCSKRYNFNKDETCPSCGVYTKPNSRRNSPQLSVKKEYGQKDRGNKPSANRTGDYRRPSSNRNDNSKPQMRVPIKTILIAVAFLIGVVSTIFEDDEPSSQPDVTVEEVVGEVAEEVVVGEEFLEEYFFDTVDTPVGSFQVNSVAEIQGDTYDETYKIIAVELEYESNSEDNNLAEDWNYLDGIALEYSDEYEYYTDYSYDMTDYVLDPYYANATYFDEFDIGYEDYISGVLFFEVPREIQDFNFIIQTVDYTDEVQTTTKYVASYYYE